MASVSVQDRWFSVVGGTRVRSARYGIGKRYEVRWRDAAGKHCSRGFARKADADAFSAKTETNLVAGRYVDPAAGRQTFRAFTEETYLEHASIGPTTSRLYGRLLRLHVYPVFGDLQIGSVRHSAAQKAVATWDRELGRNLSRQCQALTRAVFNMAVNDEAIPRSPFAKIRLSKVSVRPDRWMPESLDDVMPVL